VGPAWATTSGTRTSSFAYDATTGLLTQEVVEPNTSSLRLETDYVYDAYGNKTSVSVSGVDIVTRTSTSTYDSLGEFAVTNTNALSQSESWVYDQRFGKPTSHTGPNGLTTTWSYDVYGRKIQEVRSDGTQTKWQYLFCSGYNGGTASCVAGAVYLVQATPYASGGVTQNGPLGIVYFDVLDREIGRDTQGFDGSTIRASKQYNANGVLAQQSRPYFVSVGTAEWTTYSYDALNRALTATYPDSTTTTHAYHGLVATDTNAASETRTTTKNSQGNVVSVVDAAGNTTSYAYDPFGKLIKTTDAAGNIVTATYDVRGRKIASSDPDLGAWTYAYDTASELVSQTDAKSQTTTLSYDLLGRMTGRVENDMTSAWVYDTKAWGIGKLTAASITAGPSAGYAKSLIYDSLGRTVQVTITVGGINYPFYASYDANSRLSTVTYPSGFVATYSYTSLGYSQQVSGGSQVYWTANTRDAELRLTQQTAGSGVVTTQVFDPLTDRLISILAGGDYGVESFTYSYDVLGNVLTRSDNNESLTETLTYDNLNRLTQATVSANIAPVKTFSYNAIGNLLTKSDVGTYTYPVAGSALPHAVTSIAGTINSTFTYDPNGNQTAGVGRSITYTSYNKPASITQGSSTLFFSHDTDHQRFMQQAPEGTTVYFDAFGVHAELFSSGASEWVDYVSAGGAMLAMRVLYGSTVTTRYFHTDNLGSIAVITDASGNVVERDGYDAWGKRRFPTGADDPTGSITSQTIRGFTGQEELHDVGLVHLNGRVYDPFVARMMSADPMVEDPLNGQVWNRYSYVANNPLAFTDPSGYCFLGCGTWSNLSKMQLGTLFRSNPMLGSIVEISAAGICSLMTAGGCIPQVAAVLASSIVAGITSGRLGTAVLRAGVTAAATAAGFAVVGGVASAMPGATAAGTFVPFSQAYFADVAGSALVGCGQSAASGGKCGAGALAGAATSAAGPYTSGLKFEAGLVANAALGGVAAVLGGGKFANGAVTGAFGYLFSPLASAGTRSESAGDDFAYAYAEAGMDGGSFPSPAPEALVQVAQALPPLIFFARPPIFIPEPLDELPGGSVDIGPGSAGGPGAGKAFPRSFNDQQPEGVPCAYCGQPTTKDPGPDQLNGDHIVPRSQDGNNTPENYAPSCRTCNLNKGSQTPGQWWLRT
jgi:RHS repeat-associated protein